MPTCYFVAGLGGTSLGTSASSPDDTWISYTTFAYGLIGRMRLAADGVSPGLPDGVQLYPGPLLADYYGQSIARLTVDLAASNYIVSPHSYDWRVSARVSGPALANRIRAENTAVDPCSIVAHSFGGLVARLAWADLVRTSETALVRRIVTLGSPHWGSYGVPALWSLDSDQLLQVSLLSLASVAIFGPLSPLFDGRIWSPARLASLAATWPALYETLPSLLAPDAPADPGRSAVFGGTWPNDRGISAALQLDAVSAWQPLLTSAATTVPPWVMTTVAGYGLPTIFRLAYPSRLGNANAYNRDGDGDGQVTVSSALLGNTAQVTVVAAHADLPWTVAGSGQLAQLVLDQRAAPSPAPAPVSVPGALQFVLSGPPSPSRLSAGVGIPLVDLQYDP